VLLKFLAVGRLVRNEDGSFNRDKHQIIAAAAADKNDTANNSTYVTHLSQIMANGAEKLRPTKRVRLTSDSSAAYDLHLLADYVDGNDMYMIVFFAVTDVEFGRAHSVTQLLDDFKSGLYTSNSSEDIKEAVTDGNVDKQSQQFLGALLQKYGSNKIEQAEIKATQVASMMKDRVVDVVRTVGNLEVMQNTAIDMDKEAERMKNQTSSAKWKFRWQLYKQYIIIATVILLVVAIILIAALSSRK